MKNSVHIWVHTLETHGVQEQEELEQENFQILLRAAVETETTQKSIQDWLQLDEGDPGFRILTEEEVAAVIFFKFIFIGIIYIFKFSVYFL
jgi:hypothetical protein